MPTPPPVPARVGRPPLSGDHADHYNEQPQPKKGPRWPTSPLMPAEHKDRLLDLNQAAAFLSCSRRNINEMIRNGQLHPVDISSEGRNTKRHTWRIRVRDLEAFIRSRTFRAQQTTDDDQAA